MANSMHRRTGGRAVGHARREMMRWNKQKEKKRREIELLFPYIIPCMLFCFDCRRPRRPRCSISKLSSRAAVIAQPSGMVSIVPTNHAPVFSPGTLIFFHSSCVLFCSASSQVLLFQQQQPLIFFCFNLKAK